MGNTNQKKECDSHFVKTMHTTSLQSSTHPIHENLIEKILLIAC